MTIQLLFSNNATSTLASAILATDTSATLAAGSGGLFPNPASGQAFMLTLLNSSQTVNEIVMVTARAGDVLTIVRGQEGTAAAAWSTGSIVAHRLTAGTATAFLQAANTEIGGYAELGLLTAIVTAGVTTIFLSHGYNVGDGGGGKFNKISSGTANGVTIFADASGQLWQREYTGKIKAAWAGVQYIPVGVPITSASPDSTTALNRWLQFLCAVNTFTGELGDGVVLHGPLQPFPYTPRIRGNGGDVSILKVNPNAWPYASSSAPMMSGQPIDAEGIGFDQSWSRASFGYPTGYADGAAPSTWGGYFYGEFSGGTFRCTNSTFYNPARMFHVASAQVKFKDNNSVGTIDNPCQTICATENCVKVRKDRNTLTGIRWDGSTFGYGIEALYCWEDTKAYVTYNELEGYQHAAYGGGVGTKMHFIGNTIDNPIADTAHPNWSSVIATGNFLFKSGDEGLTFENCFHVEANNNVIQGCHTGGIGAGGLQKGGICSNDITDIGQDYAIIQTNLGKYVGGSGSFTSAIALTFQYPDTGGSEVVIANNTMGFDNLPPVSDPIGPVRAAVNALYIAPTTSTTNKITVSCIGNRAQSDYADLPLFFCNVPSHRFYSAAGGVGAGAIPGEVFADPSGNTFIYLANGGPSGFVFVKKITGTISSGTIFTGRKSGATLSPATPNPYLEWLNVVDSANFDWTTTDTTP